MRVNSCLKRGKYDACPSIEEKGGIADATAKSGVGHKTSKYSRLAACSGQHTETVQHGDGGRGGGGCQLTKVTGGENFGNQNLAGARRYKDNRRPTRPRSGRMGHPAEVSGCPGRVPKIPAPRIEISYCCQLPPLTRNCMLFTFPFDWTLHLYSILPVVPLPSR